MRKKQVLYLSLILLVPFFLGTTVVVYWYVTTLEEKASMLPMLGEVPKFSLTSEANQQVTRADFLGKITIADFIFTSCAGTCPMMSTKMAELQQKTLNDSHIQFISFSVDPETDTPDVLTRYAKQYNAVSGKWRFLTGDKALIYRITRDGFHLGLDAEGEDAIIHSKKFVLIDSRGSIRGYYDSEDEGALKKLVLDAHRLSESIDS